MKYVFHCTDFHQTHSQSAFIDNFRRGVYPNRETNVKSKALGFIGGFNFYCKYIYETPNYPATLH